VPEVNDEWVKSEMQDAKTKVGIGNATLKLLAAWKDITLSVNQQKEVIALFSRLSLGHAAIKNNPDELWIDAQPGAISLSDEVRVKADAYDGATGGIHNGRRGKVVGIRYGDIIFKSTDDKEPILDGAHYSPHQLEKRVR
jgi:hypothetical protein